MDTEAQYSFFWHKAGVDYLGMDDLENRVKGQTLTYIYDTFLAEKRKNRRKSPLPLYALNKKWIMIIFPVCLILLPICAVTMYKWRLSPVPMTRKWLLSIAPVPK